jgi:(2Fe-2S) ferredoxin
MHYFDESVKKRMNGHDPDFERQIVQEHIRSGRLVTI